MSYHRRLRAERRLLRAPPLCRLQFLIHRTFPIWSVNGIAVLESLAASLHDLGYQADYLWVVETAGDLEFALGLRNCTENNGLLDIAQYGQVGIVCGNDNLPPELD